LLLAVALGVALLRLTCMDCSVGGLRLGFAVPGMNDFQTTVYYPVRAFADAVNPYNTSEYLARYPAPQALRLYPPAMLTVFAPIAALSVEVAGQVQAVLTILLSGLLALVALRLARARATVGAVFLVWALILLSRPGQWNFLLGQITVVVVLGTYAALAGDRRSVMLAGLGLALSMLKPNFGLPLAVLMLARGQFAGVALGALLTGLLNLIPLPRLMALSGGLLGFLHMFWGDTEQLATSSGPRDELTVFRVDAGALLGRWLSSPLGWAGSLAVMAVLLAATVWILRRGKRLRADETPEPAVAGLVCCAILLSLYHIGYDILLLVWPFVGTVNRLRVSHGAERRRLSFQVVLMTGLALNYASTYSVINALDASGPLLLLLNSLNGAALLALFGLFAWDLRPRTGPSGEGSPAPSIRSSSLAASVW
jgi:hypothetical protein